MAISHLLGFIMKFLIMGPVLAMSISITPVQAQDSDGCYAVSSGCITSQSEWKNDNFIVRLANNCGKRVYIRYCVRATNGKAECGAEGVSPGRRAVSTMYRAHSSGSQSWIAVGSTKGSMDWVCAGKVNGWNDPMF